MADTAENTNENTSEEGVKIMSLDEALNYDNTGSSPVSDVAEEESEEEETQQTETNEQEEAEETTSETTKDAQASETTEEETKTVEDEAKTETEKPTETTKETEVTKVKDPYEGVLDDEDRAYLNFKKNNPGTTRADYEDSKIDYDKLDRKDLLRRKLREKYNLTDNDAELDEYIETELGIPMESSESEMSVTERVRLRNQTDDYIQAKKEQHKKWAENSTKEETTAQTEQQDIVQLEDGTKMPKAQYDKLVDDRKVYLKNNEETLNRVKESSFSMTVDDNGEKRELSYSYEHDDKDKHRVLSIVSDVQKHFNETYGTENGYDHEALIENKRWEDPIIRNKMLTSLLSKARAEAREEILKDQGNITVGAQKSLTETETKGIKYVPLDEVLG